MGGNQSREIEQLYEVLLLSKDINVQIFSQILEIMTKKGKIQDCLKFLSNSEIQNHLKINDIQKVTYILKIIKEHLYNKTNYATDIHKENRIWLIQKILKDVQIEELLKFFVRLTAVDEAFIQCGSNSLYILVEMKADLNYQFWENIRIKNTSIIGANFTKCNLSGSEFENVDMNGVNLNGAILFNCKWSNIRICEQIKWKGKKVYLICFSPDGKRIATYSDDHSIQLWDVKTGKMKKQVILNQRFCSMGFSPDGVTLSSGNLDGVIQIINVHTGKIKQILNCQSEQYYYIFFSHNGKYLLSGSKKQICLFDVQTGQLKSIVNKEQFRFLYYDGFTSVIISQGNSIKQLDVTTGILELQLDGFENNCVFSFSDGKTLVSTSTSLFDNNITLWDLMTGKKKIKIQLKTHQAEIRETCISPDGTKIAAQSWSRKFWLWDSQTGELLSQLNGDKSLFQSLRFSPDGSKLVSYDGVSFCMQEVKSLKQQQLEGHSNQVNSVRYSPDGNTLASCSRDKSILLWDVKTGKLKLQLNGHPNAVYSICYSPDGATLVSCGAEEYIRFWDVKTGKLKLKLNGMMKYIYSVQFSPDGKLLTSCDISRVINIWDAKTWELKFQLQGNKQCATPVCFSPDGLTLASVSQNITILLWDVKTCSIRLQLSRHFSVVLSICFSPDGVIFASSSEQQILLWDVVTGKLKSKFKTPQNIISLCFSPDSAMLASGSSSANFCIFLWNVQKGKLKSKLTGHSARVNSLCYSPDGTTLVSGSDDYSIRFWNVNSITSFQTRYDNFLKVYLKLNKVYNIKLEGNFLQKIISNPINNTRLIAKNPVFQAYDALIFQSSFSDLSGMNLQRLLEQKGSIILETLFK